MYFNPTFLAFYLFSSGFIYLLYPVTHVVFENLSMNYAKINPKHKQKYFVSNLLKSMILSVCSYVGMMVLYDYFILNRWNKNLVKYVGAIYAATDLVSTFIVPKMQINTVVHHLVVQVLYLISLFMFDFSGLSFDNGIVVYAIFSSFAFIVNFYLAVRLIIKNKLVLKFLASISSVVYQACCIFNWLYQLYFLYNLEVGFQFMKLIYLIVLSLVVFDDIVLIKFLNKNSFLN